MIALIVAILSPTAGPRLSVRYAVGLSPRIMYPPRITAYANAQIAERNV